MTITHRFYLIGGLTLYDAALTLYAISLLGAIELNPLLVPVIDRAGIVTAMALRAALGVAGAGVLALLVESDRNRFGVRPLRWVAWLLGAVAVWNSVQLAIYFAFVQ